MIIIELSRVELGETEIDCVCVCMCMSVCHMIAWCDIYIASTDWVGIGL